MDMLDTGIAVPVCLNLVFFRKVMSKAKSWQMIGCDNRLCAGLYDGEDKDNFYTQPVAVCHGPHSDSGCGRPGIRKGANHHENLQSSVPE